MESLLYNKPSCAVDILKNHHLPFKTYNIKSIMNSFCFFMLLHTTETQLDEKSMRWLELAELAS